MLVLGCVLVRVKKLGLFGSGNCLLRANWSLPQMRAQRSSRQINNPLPTKVQLPDCPEAQDAQ